MTLKLRRFSALPKWLVVLLLMILVGGIATVLFIMHSDNNKSGKQIDPSPTKEQYFSSDSSGAQTNLANKNYEASAALYMSAAADALATQQPVKAQTTLQEAVAKLPVQYLTWDLYQELVDAAKANGNSNLEKTSLTTSIEKAKAAGISVQQIAILQKRLDGLK